MKKQNAIRIIFASFFSSGFKSKRARVFILLSLVPVALMLVLRVMETAGSLEAKASADFFAKVMLVLYFQLLIPVLALFYGSTIVNEELDNNTLVYLTTVPVNRRSVLLGKYLAAFLQAALLVGGGFLFCFLAAALNRLERRPPGKSWRFSWARRCWPCSATAPCSPPPAPS